MSERPQSEELKKDDISKNIFSDAINSGLLYVLAGGVVFLLIYIIIDLIFDLEKHPLIKLGATFSKELGFAAIVAFIIAISIERFSRARHDNHVNYQMNKISRNVFEALFNREKYPSRLQKNGLNNKVSESSRNVFEALFQRAHDPAMIDSVTRGIYESDVYKRDYIITMALERYSGPIPGAENILVVTVAIQYWLENMTAMRINHSFESFIEFPYNAEFNKEVLLTKLKINSAELSPEEMQEADTKVADTTDFKRYSWPIEIPAHGQVSIEAQYKMIKSKQDTATWQIMGPSSGLHVTASVPDDIVIYGTAMHHAAKEGLSKTVSGIYNLSIMEPMFPNNGVVLWWAPKSVVSAESASLNPASNP